MKSLTKKQLIIIISIITVVLGFVLITTVGKPLLRSTVTATKLDDFKNVCYNGKITNAAVYTTPKTAVIAGFYETPVSDNNPWSTVTGNKNAYYATFGEHEKVNVVACFEYQPGAGKEIAKCDDIKLMSAHYKSIFYNAKTGEKISEGKEIVNDEPTCPRYVSYETISRETAKQPGTEEMDAAIKAFVEQ